MPWLLLGHTGKPTERRLSSGSGPGVDRKGTGTRKRCPSRVIGDPALMFDNHCMDARSSAASAYSDTVR